MNSTTSAESPAALRTCGGIAEHPVAARDRRGALAYGRFEPAARESSVDTGQFPRLWLPARSDFYAQPFSSRVSFYRWQTPKARMFGRQRSEVRGQPERKQIFFSNAFFHDLTPQRLTATFLVRPPAATSLPSRQGRLNPKLLSNLFCNVAP